MATKPPTRKRMATIHPVLKASIRSFPLFAPENLQVMNLTFHHISQNFPCIVQHVPISLCPKIREVCAFPSWVLMAERGSAQPWWLGIRSAQAQRGDRRGPTNRWKMSEIYW